MQVYSETLPQLLLHGKWDRGFTGRMRSLQQFCINYMIDEYKEQQYWSQVCIFYW